MKAKLLQMPGAIPVEAFSKTVSTVEPDVNFAIRAVANEDGTCPLCVVDLPNPSPHGGHCRALLTSANVDQLTAALAAFRSLCRQE